jgi:hypothetical protein
MQSAKWQHIEMRSCELVSESVLTYQMLKQLKKWWLEHISLAADPRWPHDCLQAGREPSSDRCGFQRSSPYLAPA